MLRADIARDAVPGPGHDRSGAGHLPRMSLASRLRTAGHFVLTKMCMPRRPAHDPAGTDGVADRYGRAHPLTDSSASGIYRYFGASVALITLVSAPRRVLFTGVQSWSGERAVLKLLPRAGYVVRTAWLYGVHGPNFFRTMIRLERARPTVDVVDD
jgi:RmlD substrate binding domain